MKFMVAFIFAIIGSLIAVVIGLIMFFFEIVVLSIFEADSKLILEFGQGTVILFGLFGAYMGFVIGGEKWRDWLNEK